MFLHYEHSLESCKSFVLFGNGNSHNQILGRSQDAVIGKVREAQSKLPPTKIARDGSIMEWVSHYFEFRTLLRSYHLLRPMTVIDFENLFIKCGHVYISSLLYGRHKILRIQIRIIDMYRIFLACFQGTQ